MRPVTAYRDVTEYQFVTEIAPANRPAILKGLVKDWPAVKLAEQSAEAVTDYLKACDTGLPGAIILGDPKIKGEFFYGPTTQSINFEHAVAPFSETLDRLLAQRDLAEPQAVYIQSAPIQEHFPRFRADNRIAFVPPNIEPRIWIGNALRVQTHYDLSHNIACLVAGRRRFTLFPPEQLVNLYPGPLDKTLAGAPISMVSLEQPDFERYPRFALALEQAQVAELEPGDGLFIPYFWWHHVRSYETFNILVNYWWNNARTDLGSPYQSLMHTILTIRDLPPNQREAWRTMFGYYAFGSHGDPVAHMPPEDRGTLGPIPPALNRQMRIALFQTELARLLQG